MDIVKVNFVAPVRGSQFVHIVDELKQINDPIGLNELIVLIGQNVELFLLVDDVDDNRLEVLPCCPHIDLT